MVREEGPEAARGSEIDVPLGRWITIVECGERVARSGLCRAFCRCVLTASTNCAGARVTVVASLLRVCCSWKSRAALASRASFLIFSRTPTLLLPRDPVFPLWYPCAILTCLLGPLGLSVLGLNEGSNTVNSFSFIFVSAVLSSSAPAFMSDSSSCFSLR